ncbi:winged helix-turn-helix domain-containing protein [Brevibacillus ginsengisoli]|uniref:response regulator transcription factor n=1 Tax=Brevibacillus ginsengisoli TaxID=363854 RepID=UPI003CE7D550
MSIGIYIPHQADCYVNLQKQLSWHYIQLLKEKKTPNIKEIRFIILDIDNTPATPYVIHYSKKYSNAAIFVLTSMRNEHDLLNAFAHGADDYQVKPCPIKEVATRIRVILKRKQHHLLDSPSYSHLDVKTRSFEWRGKTLQLTKMECKILEVLYQNKNSLLTREQLVQGIWEGGIDPNSKAIHVHIFNLRKKLWNMTEGQVTINTVTNRGIYITTNMKPS